MIKQEKNISLHVQKVNFEKILILINTYSLQNKMVLGIVVFDTNYKSEMLLQAFGIEANEEYYHFQLFTDPHINPPTNMRSFLMYSSIYYTIKCYGMNTYVSRIKSTVVSAAFPNSNIMHLCVYRQHYTFNE